MTTVQKAGVAGLNAQEKGRVIAVGEVQDLHRVVREVEPNSGPPLFPLIPIRVE